jgi:hypothetical protein
MEKRAPQGHKAQHWGHSGPRSGHEGAGALDWYKTVFELIDMRSFSNLWFWIALAVMWSSASHWVLGVPFDLVLRARRQKGDAEQDLRMLIQVNVKRLVHIADVAGLLLVGITAFVLTTLAVLGFVYDIEFAQALLCLMAPMTLVAALSLRTAHLIDNGPDDVPAMIRRLARQRMTIQGIGMVSIFVTALWGMWQNLQLGTLGG